MAKQYVMTLTAANRVGILAAVSNAIAELGGDVQEVSVTVMQGFFTIILCADFPDHRESRVIIDHIHDIGRPYELEVCLKDPATQGVETDSETPRTRHFLKVQGKNQPGMMRQIAAILAQEDVDIADFYAHRKEDGRFEMSLEICVPQGVSTNGLIEGIETIDASVSAALEDHADWLNSHPPHSLRTGSLDLDRDVS
ncbi:MAG: hypothetical protein Tsb009_23860 [Planctomycetaceae bacterium]